MRSMKVLKSLLVVGLLCSMNGMVAKAEEDNEKQAETLSTSKEMVKVATGNDVDNVEEGEAKIGEQYYATLQDALDAAVDGDVVVVTKDIDTTADDIAQNRTWGYGIIEKSITLDLNNHTISGIASTGMFKVVANNVENVTICNGKIINQSESGLSIGILSD